MFSREESSQVRVNVASLKDEMRGFSLPKCGVHSRERGRV